MIRVPRVPEPEGFSTARAKGQQWLRTRSTQRPPASWSEFRGHLAHGFADRCGYTAMRIQDGQVDHYRCQRDHRALTYEWSNYRYCCGSINSRKGCKDVLDPHEVHPEWFQLHYPSLQLLLTAAVPEHERARAERTIIELGLRDGEFLLRARRRWLDMYLASKLTLEGLQDIAPLLASMVERERLQPGAGTPPSV